MMQVFVFQEAPVFHSHFTKKGVMPGQLPIQVMLPVLFQRLEQILFFHIKVTFKINDKFPKSRHISGNSVIEDLHFLFGKRSDSRI